MKQVLLGVIQIDPRKILEDGIRKQLVTRISQSLHHYLQFQPVDKRQGLQPKQVEDALNHLAAQLDGFKTSFEYVLLPRCNSRDVLSFLTFTCSRSVIDATLTNRGWGGGAAFMKVHPRLHQRVWPQDLARGVLARDELQCGAGVQLVPEEESQRPAEHLPESCHSDSSLPPPCRRSRDQLHRPPCQRSEDFDELQVDDLLPRVPWLVPRQRRRGPLVHSTMV